MQFTRTLCVTLLALAVSQPGLAKDPFKKIFNPKKADAFNPANLAKDVTLEDLFGPVPTTPAPKQPQNPVAESTPVPASADPLDALFNPSPVETQLKTQPTPESDGPSKAELLRRIEQLEKRLAEIEARQSESPRVTPPHGIPAPGNPKFRREPSPHTFPQNPRPNLNVPVEPPTKTVPPNWKKFHFNGEDYYYIPVKDVTPVMPLPSY